MPIAILKLIASISYLSLFITHPRAIRDPRVIDYALTKVQVMSELSALHPDARYIATELLTKLEQRRFALG